MDAARGWRKAAEALTGYDPGTCPYRTLADPFVVDVIRAYRFFETGQAAMYLGPDPDADLVEALGVYHGCRQRVIANDMKNHG